MTALGWGPGPSLIFGVIFIMICIFTQQAFAAPVYEHEATGLDILHEELNSGCYYNFQHYEEADRILTNEPCLNCTCHNRMLMCYLRVCPFTKAIGENCKIEKRADQCCPVITCPEVPVHLLTSTTTASPATDSSEVGHLDNYGCTLNDLFYSDGARVPSDSNKPCELCYCIRNKTTCIMQECTLHVQGCKPVYQDGVCCPVRYDCDREDEDLLETTVSSGLLLTTTMSPGASTDCKYNSNLYTDGELIKTESPCEHCYCMRGEIVCAVQECGQPMEKTGTNCVAIPKEGQCCPEYECDNTTFTTTLSPYDELTTSVISEEISTESKLPLESDIVSGHRDDDKLNKADDSGIIDSESPVPSDELSTESIDETSKTPEASDEDGEKSIPTQEKDTVTDKYEQVDENIVQTTEESEEQVDDHKVTPSESVISSDDVTTSSKPLDENEQKPTESNDIPDVIHSEDTPKHNLPGLDGENQVTEKQEEELLTIQETQENTTPQSEISSQSFLDQDNISDQETPSKETEKPQEINVTDEQSKEPDYVITSKPEEEKPVSEEEPSTEISEDSIHMLGGDAVTTENIKSEDESVKPITSATPLVSDSDENKPTEIVSDIEIASTSEAGLQEIEQPAGTTPEIAVRNEIDTTEPSDENDYEHSTSTSEKQTTTSRSVDVQGTDRTETEEQTQGPYYLEEKTTKKPEEGLEETTDNVLQTEEPKDSSSDEHTPTAIPDQSIEDSTKPIGDRILENEPQHTVGDEQTNLPEGKLPYTTESIIPSDEQEENKEVDEQTSDKPTESDEQLETSEKPSETSEKPVESVDQLEVTEKSVNTDEYVPGTSENPDENEPEVTEKPIESEEHTPEIIEKPHEDGEQSETTKKPTESDEPLETSEKPAESDEPLETSEKPAESDESLETSEKPAESDEPLETSEKPAESDEPLETSEKPVESNEPLESSEKPDDSGEYSSEPSIQPVESDEHESTASENPAEVDDQYKTTDKPAESNDSEENETSEKPDEINIPEASVKPDEQLEATEKPSEDDKQEPDITQKPITTDEQTGTSEHPFESDALEHTTSEYPTKIDENEPVTSEKPSESNDQLETSETPVESDQHESETSEKPDESSRPESETTEKQSDRDGQIETSEKSVETDEPLDSSEKPYVTPDHELSEKPMDSTEHESESSEETSESNEQPETSEKPSESVEQQETSSESDEPSEKPAESEVQEPETSDRPTDSEIPDSSEKPTKIEETPNNEVDQSRENEIKTTEQPSNESEVSEEYVTESLEKVDETSEIFEHKPEIVSQIPTESSSESSVDVSTSQVSEKEPSIVDTKETTESVTPEILKQPEDTSEVNVVEEEVTKPVLGNENLPIDSQNAEKATHQPEEASHTTVPSRIEIQPSEEAVTTETTLLQGEPHVIPGEGDCLVDGLTYTNNSFVQPTNPCQLSCKCISSIVQCEMIECSPPPSDMVRCMPVFHGDENCCPTYNCEGTESKTPASDSQIMEQTPKLPELEKTPDETAKTESTPIQETVKESEPEVIIPVEPIQVEISTESSIHDNNIPPYIPVDTETDKPGEQIPDTTEQTAEVASSKDKSTEENEPELDVTTVKSILHEESTAGPISTPADKLEPPVAVTELEHITEKTELSSESEVDDQELPKDIVSGTTPKLDLATEQHDLSQGGEESSQQPELTTTKVEQVPLEGSSESPQTELEETHSEYPNEILPVEPSTSQPIIPPQENEIETSTSISEPVLLDKEEVGSNEIPSDDISKQPEPSVTEISTEHEHIVAITDANEVPVQTIDHDANENEVLGDSKTEEIPIENVESSTPYPSVPSEEHSETEKTPFVSESSTEGAKPQETETEDFVIELGDISTQRVESGEKTTVPTEILSIPLDSTEIPSIVDQEKDNDLVPTVEEEKPITTPETLQEVITEESSKIPPVEGQEPIIFENEITTSKADEEQSIITDAPRLEQTDSHNANEIIPVQTVTDKPFDVYDTKPTSIPSDSNEDISGTTASVLTEDTRDETLAPVYPSETSTELTDSEKSDVTTVESEKVEQPLEVTSSDNVEVSEQTTTVYDIKKTEKPENIIPETESEPTRTDEISSEVPEISTNAIGEEKPIEQESESKPPKVEITSPVSETQTDEPSEDEQGKVSDADQISELSTSKPLEETQDVEKPIDVVVEVESSTSAEDSISQVTESEDKVPDEQQILDHSTSILLDGQEKPEELVPEIESTTSTGEIILQTEISSVKPDSEQHPTESEKETSVPEDENKDLASEAPEIVTSEPKDVSKPEEGESLIVDEPTDVHIPESTTNTAYVQEAVEQSSESTSNEIPSSNEEVPSEQHTEYPAVTSSSEQTTRESVSIHVDVETSSEQVADEHTDTSTEPEKVDIQDINVPLEGKPEGEEQTATSEYLELTTTKTSIDENRETSNEKDSSLDVTTNTPLSGNEISDIERSTEGEKISTERQPIAPEETTNDLENVQTEVTPEEKAPEYPQPAVTEEVVIVDLDVTTVSEIQEPEKSSESTLINELSGDKVEEPEPVLSVTEVPEHETSIITEDSLSDAISTSKTPEIEIQTSEPETPVDQTSETVVSSETEQEVSSDITTTGPFVQEEETKPTEKQIVEEHIPTTDEHITEGILELSTSIPEKIEPSEEPITTTIKQEIDTDKNEITVELTTAGINSEEQDESSKPTIENENAKTPETSSEYASTESDLQEVPELSTSEPPSEHASAETELPSVPELSTSGTPSKDASAETELPIVLELSTSEPPSEHGSSETELPIVPELSTSETPSEHASSETERPIVPELSTIETPSENASPETELPNVPELSTSEPLSEHGSPETELPIVPELSTSETPSEHASSETERPIVPELSTSEAPNEPASPETELPIVPELSTSEIPSEHVSTDAEVPKVPELSTSETPSDHVSTETELPKVPELSTSAPTDVVATEIPENATATVHEHEDEVTTKPVESVEDDKQTSEVPSISSHEPDYVQVPIEQSSDDTPSHELSTSGPVFESSTQQTYSTQNSLNVTAPPRVPGEDIVESQKPVKPDYQQPQHPDDFGQMPQQYPYPPETDDYDEDDSTAFGPGTCRYGGKVYVSAQQIPRDDPCDFCFCFRSDIICLQQSCPPPIPGCHEEPIQGFCCPRYECPVSMATVLNVTTTTTTTTTTLPPHFLHHAYKGAASRRGCQIQGKAYQVGEVVKSKSGPCLHCTCGGDGQMECNPKVCSPQPMIQQMIAAVATSRSVTRR